MGKLMFHLKVKHFMTNISNYLIWFMGSIGACGRTPKNPVLRIEGMTSSVSQSLKASASGFRLAKMRS
jgi:hypothetical protein